MIKSVNHRPVMRERSGDNYQGARCPRMLFPIRRRNHHWRSRYGPLRDVLDGIEVAVRRRQPHRGLSNLVVKPREHSLLLRLILRRVRTTRDRSSQHTPFQLARPTLGLLERLQTTSKVLPESLSFAIYKGIPTSPKRGL